MFVGRVRQPVPIERDPRFNKNPTQNAFQFSKNVKSSMDMSSINAEAFSSWIDEEIGKYSLDPFLPGLIKSHLEDKVLKSQHLAQNIYPYLKENAIPFIEKLWELLVDASNNENGIPKVIMDKARETIEPNTDFYNEAVKLLVEDSSSPQSSRPLSPVDQEIENSSSSESEDSSSKEKKHHHRKRHHRSSKDKHHHRKHRKHHH